MQKFARCDVFINDLHRALRHRVLRLVGAGADVMRAVKVFRPFVRRVIKGIVIGAVKG